MKPVIVVPSKIRRDAIEALEKEATVRQWVEKEPIPKSILKEWLTTADGYWSISSIPVDEDLIKDAKQLKVIAQSSVGYDNVDIDVLTNYHIPYGNTPHVLTETTAELGFTLVCCASRRIIENAEYVKEGKWIDRPSPIKGFDLSRKTIGIIGMGNIGLSISRRARAFGMTVVYHNRKQRNDDALHMITYKSLDDLLAISDVVLVVTPLTEETYHMCNKNFFNKMKKEALFVNIGRGPIVDTEALVEALSNERISYAALDVTDPEPLPGDHPLLQTGKCLVVPHIGSYTDRCRHDMAMLTVENLLKGTKKEALRTCVNEEVNYK